VKDPKKRGQEKKNQAQDPGTKHRNPGHPAIVSPVNRY
jgi:hypothetical protein